MVQVAQTASEPLVETLATTSEPFGDTAAAITTPLGDTLQTTAEPVGQAAQPVTALLDETIAPIPAPLTEPVEAVTQSVAAVVQPATEPVVAVVEPVVATVEPVAGTIADGTAPVVDTVSDVTAPIADTTPTTGADPIAGVGAAADPIVGAVPWSGEPALLPPAGMPIGAGPDSVPVPIVETPDAAATVLPFVPPVGDETPTVGESGAVAMAPTPVVSPGPESPAFPSGDLLPAVPDAGRGVQSSTDVVGDAQLAIGDALDDMLLDGVAAALPVAAALGIASLTAVSIARGVCSPGASVMFTNVRLVPCLVGSAVERSAMVGSQAVSRLGSNGTSSDNATAGKRAAVPAIVGTIVDPIRDGFESVVARPRAEDAERLRDARLLMQFGIVLGTIYLAFLTVWFWATRVRLKPRL